MPPDFDVAYRAVASRDARFDGHFITAVRTTGVYCRPSCPATTPRRANVEFLPTAGAAQQRGYRACRRCLPDAVPGSPEWNVRADLAARAMRLIADGVVEREGVSGLAARLGYSERHLNRVLGAEMGAGPLALARAHRAHTARLLVETTSLAMADVAFAAGFASVRQFNDTVRAVYGVAPTTLRTEAGRRRGAVAAVAGTVVLRLPYRPPFDAAGLRAFLAARALDGVESSGDDGYARTLRLPHGAATVALAFPDAPYVVAALRPADPRDLGPAVARVRRLLDLDADPAADRRPARRPTRSWASLGRRHVPGIRLPGAVDGTGDRRCARSSASRSRWQGGADDAGRGSPPAPGDPVATGARRWRTRTCSRPPRPWPSAIAEHGVGGPDRAGAADHDGPLGSRADAGRAASLALASPVGEPADLTRRSWRPVARHRPVDGRLRLAMRLLGDARRAARRPTW
jgi:methylphosphotriester-DNA--protein-cysteine methyltransferase